VRQVQQAQQALNPVAVAVQVGLLVPVLAAQVKSSLQYSQHKQKGKSWLTNAC
jgi:hypothetical protein